MTYGFQELGQRPDRRAAPPRNGAVRAGHCTRILVPVDFSRANDGAVAEAIARAVPNDSTIWLLHVVEPDPALAGMEAVVLAKPEATVVAEAVARLELLAARARTSTSGYVIDAIVRQGRRDEVICRVADELHADLIVLGQHEHGWWVRRLARTTTERILRHAPCPVLALPGAGTADDAMYDIEGGVAGEGAVPEPSRERINNDEAQAAPGASSRATTRDPGASSQPLRMLNE